MQMSVGEFAELERIPKSKIVQQPALQAEGFTRISRFLTKL